MYVCMYACMHACMHACMYVCMYVHSNVGVRTYICTYVRTYGFRLVVALRELLECVWIQRGYEPWYGDGHNRMCYLSLALARLGLYVLRCMWSAMCVTCVGFDD